MARTRRMAGVGGLLAAVAIGPALWAAEAKPDIPAQQEKQKQVQAETDRLVRRLTTTLRVMAYYQLDKTEEKQLLDEVVTTLAGLSREQMTDVLARLDAAARAYSLISAIAAADSKLSAGERSGRREAAAAAAVALLEKRRVAGGFADPEHIKGLETSTDLDPLRSRADFQRVLDKVEAHSHAPSP